MSFFLLVVNCFFFSHSLCLCLLQQFNKRLHDYEPRFTEATDTANKLCKDPAFSSEQNKALQQDAEDCEKKWDDLLDKVNERMDG